MGERGDDACLVAVVHGLGGFVLGLAAAALVAPAVRGSGRGRAARLAARAARTRSRCAEGVRKATNYSRDGEGRPRRRTCRRLDAHRAREAGPRTAPATGRGELIGVGSPHRQSGPTGRGNAAAGPNHPGGMIS